MRTRMILPAALLLGVVPFAAEARESTTVTAVVDKIVTQEQAEVQMLRASVTARFERRGGSGSDGMRRAG